MSASIPSFGLVIFAGGITFSGSEQAAVDIFNGTTGALLSTATLSQARDSGAAAVLGSKALFAVRTRL